MDSRITTRHPDAEKSGVSISREKYETIRAAILDMLARQDEVTFRQLLVDINEALTPTFDGSVSWYVTTVKLDLEARGEIERIAGSNPQRLRLRQAD